MRCSPAGAVPCSFRPWQIGTYLERLFRFLAEKTEKPARVRDGQRSSDAAEVSAHAARLMDTYGDCILRYAYSYLQNRSDAEDVLQDTLIQFLKTCPELEPGAHEKAWLLRVAANLCKNKLKYHSLHRTDELSDQLALEQREDLSFVWEAVKSLPEHYRSTIHLYYYENCSTAQIAEILQKKESTIRSYLHRGREKLKTVLREGYDFA